MKRPTADDLTAALLGVEGWHTTAALLPVYLDWAAREGRDTVNAKTLGEALRSNSCLDSIRRRGVTVWYVDKEGLECRNWFVQT